jgi:hypothetical protein
MQFETYKNKQNLIEGGYMSNIANRLILILAFNSFCFSGIINSIDTVDVYENIVFNPHSITDDHSYPSSYPSQGNYVYYCNVPLPQMDIFIAPEIPATCTYPCSMISIGSSKSFYLSKINFDSFDFEKRLNLADTNKFIKYDTIRNDEHGGRNDSNDCFLPHFLYGSISRPFKSPGNFVIINNANNLYVLVKFEPIDSVYTKFMGRDSHVYLHGFKMTSYLQDNGSLDFNDMTRIKLNRSTLISNQHIQNKKLKGYFDLYGRIFVSDNKYSDNIIIERNERGIIRKRIINRNSMF